MKFLPHTPRDFSDLRLPAPLKDNLCARGSSGVVLIGGQPQSGRRSTAASLIVSAARARGPLGASVLTLESPIGYVFTESMLSGSVSIPSTVLQIEPGIDTPDWAAAAEVAFGGDWDIVYVASTRPVTARGEESIAATVPEIARTGKLVITTALGSTFSECFRSACAMPNRDEERLVARRLAQQLRAIIVQEVIRSRGPDGRPAATYNAMVLHLRPEDRETLTRAVEYSMPDADTLRRTLDLFLKVGNPACYTRHEALQRIPKHLASLSTLSD